MNVLKVRSRGGLNRFVGILLNQSDNALLATYALAKEITKSQLIRQLITVWSDDQRRHNVEPELLNEIVSRLKSQWATEQSSSKPMSREQFTDAIQTELLTKGLSINNVKYIIDNI